mmetsp:Transcript_36747/g.95147  ORF Transcript_36747/g.95147 Transcript_36747/m.95147 type:complete len:129 (+) Transcript_36747:455-841(+)
MAVALSFSLGLCVPVALSNCRHENTFWLTTGLFPQEFIIAMPQTVKLSVVKTYTVNVKKLEFECCDGAQPVNFERVFEHVSTSDQGGKIQREVHKMTARQCKFLRFTITAAFDNFAAVHMIKVEGTPA